MDTFDFQACISMLYVYKKLGRGYPTSWEDGGDFQEYLVRMAARECMKQAAIHGFAGHSYFSSFLTEGEDQDGPWVKLELFFGNRTYEDGTSYEK